jgi:hypothetical protein
VFELDVLQAGRRDQFLGPPMVAPAIPHHDQGPADHLTLPPEDVDRASAFTFSHCTSKQQPTRVRVDERTTARITLDRSRWSHEPGAGARPVGAQDRRFTGWSRKPASVEEDDAGDPSSGHF